MNDKKIYKPAEIRILTFGRDLLITSAGTLGTDGWDVFDFSSLS